MAKYVTMQDAVWKVSERDFKRLQNELRRTGCVEYMDHYGKMVIDRILTIDEIIMPFWSDNHDGNT